MPRSLTKIHTLAAAGFIAAYFVYYTSSSLLAEFTHDDLMNCYRAWSYSLPSLLADNLLFFRFTPMYRPFGALVYKVFFAPFGFDLFPLRVLLLLILAANTYLVYKLCRLLTGSMEAGLLAALLHAYHMKLSPLYYNTGTLYDIFAFFFYFAAVALYVNVRRAGKNWKALSVLAIVFLYILALNSKELAASLPLTLFIYELLWHPPSLEKYAILRWLTSQTCVVWITAAMTVAFAQGRVLAQEGGISGVGHYTLTISVEEYVVKVAHYLNELTYSQDWFDLPWAAFFILLLLAMSAAGRSRGLLFSTLLFLVGILPMAFISPRAISAIYIPLAGLAMFGGVLLGLACEGLRRVFLRQAWQPLAFWIVFGATALFLVRFHHSAEHIYVASTEQYSVIRNAREQLKKLHPEFPPRSRILIFGTPFPQYSPGYINLFLIRLAYRDDSLQIQEKARLEENQQPLIPTDYDYLLSYEDGRWHSVDPATLLPPGPEAHGDAPARP